MLGMVGFQVVHLVGGGSERIGDLVVAARDDSALVDSRILPPQMLGLVGLHGSLTQDELVVPLLVSQADE